MGYNHFVATILMKSVCVVAVYTVCIWCYCKLYYQQLHLKYLCNLARYWLQAVWGWQGSVETCGSVIICEIIVHLLVIVQNKKKTLSFPQIPRRVRGKHTVTRTTTLPSPSKLFNITLPYSPYNSAADGTLQNNQTIRQ